ncbi:hypothetical protein PSECIP111951_01133 [Pseudoalteromonas holothuriae]|uniref:Uncharacterized protein n=1 Tax=Pseudoalteromonas holothuriae TaxID=2963714 RepID=A0A9W4QXE6_9GAMM|nr:MULTISPECIES: hypothetical protein [unclassified Pseudoalteromonas]CAH9054902.1 hypothetical protein PSECIP111951_01133 [Pseudoalteromonas sp. CIP111951]CAH9057595.1 hypothetical protein PSECIP111854_02030 [Pseudoalteromonas sp. CIP111854]
MSYKNSTTLARQASEALHQAKTATEQAQCDDARSYAYQREADGLAFKYLALVAEYGEQHEHTLQVKAKWLTARKTIQARYPKPNY